jgi:hypothetical protein
MYIPNNKLVTVKLIKPENSILCIPKATFSNKLHNDCAARLETNKIIISKERLMAAVNRYTTNNIDAAKNPKVNTLKEAKKISFDLS